MYKTAEELGIEQWEFNGLLAVVDLLKKDAVHATEEVMESETKLTQPLFNMDYCAHKYDCGTVACIGGWTYILHNALDHEMLSNADVSAILDYVEPGGVTGKLFDLYYPSAVLDYSAITIDHALEAIDNFLTTGKPNWLQIVGDPTEA